MSDGPRAYATHNAHQATDVSESAFDEDELEFAADQGILERVEHEADVHYVAPEDGIHYVTVKSAIPDNAVSISDPSEAPEDAQVTTGPRGGTYYVPGGGDDDSPAGGGGTTPELSDDAPDTWDGSDGARDQLQSAVKDIVDEGASVSEALEAAEQQVDNLDGSGRRTVAETAYANQSGEIEIGGESVEVSPVMREAYSSGESDVRTAAEAQLSDEFVSESAYGPESHDSQREYDAWRAEEDGSLLNSNTAELWGAAIDTTGNDNVPDDAAATPDTVGDPLPAAEDPDADPLTAVGDNVQNTREVLSEMFGDTVPVARGVSGEFAEEIREAAESGDEVELDHRALESWSTFPGHSEEFAGDDGIIIQTEVPVDEVWGSSHTTPGLDEHENELIVGKEGSESYSPDEIYTTDDDDIAELYESAGERL